MLAARLSVATALLVLAMASVGCSAPLSTTTFDGVADAPGDGHNWQGDGEDSGDDEPQPGDGHNWQGDGTESERLVAGHNWQSGGVGEGSQDGGDADVPGAG